MNTRQQIIEATERAIQTKGLARVTTKEIAREAGYAEGTLYKHFETKEDLFLAVIQENLPGFVATLDEERVGKGDIGENLRAIAEAAIRYYEQLISLTVPLFADASLLGHHREWMREQGKGPQLIYERVATYIEGEQRLGRVSERVAPFGVISLLLGACFEYAFLQHFLGERPFATSEQQCIKEIVEALIHGVLP